MIEARLYTPYNSCRVATTFFKRQKRTQIDPDKKGQASTQRS